MTPPRFVFFAKLLDLSMLSNQRVQALFFLWWNQLLIGDDLQMKSLLSLREEGMGRQWLHAVESASSLIGKPLLF
jgi:hypothetical protein